MTNQKKCKRVTKKGTPCLRKALSGSEYCRIHQPREIWLPVFISIIINVILSIIVTVLIASHFSRESFDLELSLRHISRPRIIPAVGGFPVVIDDGIYVLITKPGFVTHKMGSGPFEYRINEDGEIKIYGEIRHTDGTLVVEATGDRINVLPNAGLDINSDSRACEIVDSEKNPIYQISVVPFEQWNESRSQIASKIKSQIASIRNILNGKKPSFLEKLNPIDRAIIENQMQERNNRMQNERDKFDALFSQANKVVGLYYIHRTGDRWWCVTPEGSQGVDNRESMKEWQSKIPRLFKYPGKKYPGVRLNNQSQ